MNESQNAEDIQTVLSILAKLTDSMKRLERAILEADHGSMRHYVAEAAERRKTAEDRLLALVRPRVDQTSLS